MPMTDAQRKANRKWDSANYAAVTCKPRKEVTEQFREACHTNGTSPNAVLVSAIEFYNRDPEGFRAVQDLAGPFLAACDALNLSPANCSSAAARAFCRMGIALYRRKVLPFFLLYRVRLAAKYINRPFLELL